MHLELFTFELNEFLQKGENTILVKATDGGSLPCGILCELAIDAQPAFVSDESWLVLDATKDAALPATLDSFEPAYIMAPYGTGAWGKGARVLKSH